MPLDMDMMARVIAQAVKDEVGRSVTPDTSLVGRIDALEAENKALREKLAEQAAQSGGQDFTVERAGTLEEAVVKAADIVRKKGYGKVVLSPACASYDMFEHFEHRGDTFARIVNSIRKEK